MKNKIYLVTLSPYTHRTSEENLGILYLKSSLQKDGYEVDIIDGWLNEYTVSEVANMIKDDDNLLFVGISSYMSNTEPSIELIKILKERNPGIKIVCGGFGPTFYPKEHLESGCDFVSRGEGEISLVKLANALKYNTDYHDIRGISYIDNGNFVNNECQDLVEDLDSLPFPSRDTMEKAMANKSTINMLTSRGCSGRCEFCSVISFFRLSSGRVWRTRSIKNIVDEIELLYSKGARYIKMVDDSFIDGIRDEKWCFDFLNEIKSRNIDVKLRGQIRADKINENILKYLKEAGFFSFACGIENGSRTALKRMNKAATLEQNIKALELFKKYDYLVQMGFILFDANTTIEELIENYEFIKRFDFTVTKGIFSEMYSAEGTPLNTRLRGDKKLEESDFIHNNNKYRIEDEDVLKVYLGLKQWHKSHSYIYDMTIDPLTAPKAIDEIYRQELYRLTLELKKRDLEVFKHLLNIYKNTPKEIADYINSMIEDSKPYYDEVLETTQKNYKKAGLYYNAVNNPFI